MELPLTIALAAACLVVAPAVARDKPAVPAPAPAPAATASNEVWPEAYFEIFKLAPGKQEEFIRRIARADEVSKAGEQPPIQMFGH